MDEPRTLPLSLKQDGLSVPVLKLAGVDITRFVAADGLSIDYDVGKAGGGDGIPVPVVTLRFGPGALDLDFDVELLERLLVDARAKVDHQ